MSEEKKNAHLKASIYYLFGTVAGQGVVLLSSTIFTRIMSKEAYGLVNTYSAWVLVLNTFIGLNLFITVRNAYIDYRSEYHKFTSSILLFSLITYAVFTGCILGALTLFEIKTDLFVVFLAALQAIALHTINYQMAVLSMENNYRWRTVLLAFPNILHTVLSVVLVILYSRNQYYGKIVGNAFGLAFFAVIIIIYNFKKERPRICKEYWKYAAAISVPGIMLTLSDLILLESDRIMLTNLVGPHETAVYSLIYNIGSILFALYTAINGSWTPWFYKKLASGEETEIKKVEALYIRLFTLLTIGLLTVSPEIVRILSPKTYWTGIDYVNLIVFASFLMFLYAFFTTYLMYLKKPVIIARNTAFAAILNLILNYFMIPSYGGTGAAIATNISYIILFSLHYAAAKKYDTGLFCKRQMALGISVLALYSIVFYFIWENWLIRYLIVAGIILILITRFLKFRKTTVSER